MKAFMVASPRSMALRALNYSPAIERIRSKGSTSARTLRDIVRSFGPAYGTVFTRLDCDPEHGIELLSQGDMFTAEPRGRIIRRDSLLDPEKHMIEKGQVLIAGAGTLGENELYGRAILADNRTIGKYVGPDSMTIVFKEPNSDFALFAYAWLSSPTGVSAVRSTSYGSKILRFRAELLTSLPVPVAARPVVTKVANLIRTSVQSRDTYVQQIAAARDVVAKGTRDEGLHVGEQTPSNVGPRVVLWKGPFPSLRAWNFASMGNDLSSLRRKWPSTLRDWLQPDGIFKGGRVSRASCTFPFGVDLLSQRDVFAIRPVPRRIQEPYPSLKVEPHYLLVASRGQMNDGALFGKIERGCHLPAGGAVSEDILRLVPRKDLSGGLFSFLSSPLGLKLLRTTAYGTSIPGMREDMILDLPAPAPDSPWIKAASKLADAASRARLVALEAEEEAFRIVEQEVLPQWLA